MKEYEQAVDLWYKTKEGDRSEFPLMKRVVIDDATTEAIQSVLKGSPQGVLCVQDELSALFGRIEKYGGKGGAADRAFYLRLYNGGSYIVDDPSNPYKKKVPDGDDLIKLGEKMLSGSCTLGLNC